MSDTKTRILEEALTLFSIKGYKGTSVKNIADAVGIKDASLYKHFKSKQAILDEILELIMVKIQEMSQQMGFPEKQNEDAAWFSDMGDEQIVGLSRKMFIFYLTDSYISKFWRMATMEQYQNEEVYRVFAGFFYEAGIQYQTELFAQLIKLGVFKEADPSVMAMNFYTPIFFLLSKYSNHPEKQDEALAVLEKQVREFIRIYGK